MTSRDSTRQPCRAEVAKELKMDKTFRAVLQKSPSKGDGLTS